MTLLLALTALARKFLLSYTEEQARQAIDAGNSEQHWVFFDDLLSPATGDWAHTSTGAGANINQGFAFINSTTNMVGCKYTECGTTSTGFSSLHTWNNALLCNTGTQFTYETRLIPDALSTAAQEYKIQVGLGNALNTGAPTREIAFRYDRLTDGANWQCITNGGGGTTKTNSGVAVNSGTSGTPQVLKLVVAADGSGVWFYIDGNLIIKHTTNIPGNAAGDRMGIGQWILKSAGTTSVQVGYDWVRFSTLRTAAR